jgi:hypothetical protein
MPNDQHHGEGWIIDASGYDRKLRVEVEQDQFEDVIVKGQQNLTDAGIDATGATIVINWGKQMSEQAIVRSQVGANISFDMIPCPNETVVPYKIPPYVSCSTKPFIKMKKGEEQGMASYFLTGKLELLDVDEEWHFEKSGGSGGTLYVKVSGGSKPTKRFWGRTLDLALQVDCNNKDAADNMRVEGLSFFATRLQSDRCKGLQLLANRFYYATHSRRAIGQLDAPEGVYLTKADNALIDGNEFYYSEGKAISYDGRNTKFTHNIAEWNGFHGIDGPATVKISGGGQSQGAVVKYNTLRWCGTVSGLFSMAPDAELAHNLVEHQNWGGVCVHMCESMHTWSSMHETSECDGLCASCKMTAQAFM